MANPTFRVDYKRIGKTLFRVGSETRRYLGDFTRLKGVTVEAFKCMVAYDMSYNGRERAQAEDIILDQTINNRDGDTLKNNVLSYLTSCAPGTISVEPQFYALSTKLQTDVALYYNPKGIDVTTPQEIAEARNDLLTEFQEQGQEALRMMTEMTNKISFVNAFPEPKIGEGEMPYLIAVEWFKSGGVRRHGSLQGRTLRDNEGQCWTGLDFMGDTKVLRVGWLEVVTDYLMSDDESVRLWLVRDRLELGRHCSINGESSFFKENSPFGPQPLAQSDGTVKLSKSGDAILYNGRQFFDPMSETFRRRAREYGDPYNGIYTGVTYENPSRQFTETIKAQPTSAPQPRFATVASTSARFEEYVKSAPTFELKRGGSPLQIDS